MLGDLRFLTQRLEISVFKLRTLNETVELAARIHGFRTCPAGAPTTMRAVRATAGSIMLLDGSIRRADRCLARHP
jgi:hypothetical protein